MKNGLWEKVLQAVVVVGVAMMVLYRKDGA